jgi:hypothetical protein
MANTGVQLRNGKTVPETTAKTTLIELRRVAQDPLALFELVEVCRNPDHVILGNYGASLQALGLLTYVDEGGRGVVHDDTRDVILAATEGDDLDLHLVSPFAPAVED